MINQTITPPDDTVVENTQNLISEAYAHPPSSASQGLLNAIDQTLSWLDSGSIRVATPPPLNPSQNQEASHHQPHQPQWQVHGWIKQALLLSFRYHPSRMMTDSATSSVRWFDKVPLKFSSWTEHDFTQANIRCVPGAVVRYTAHIARGVVLMPCFVNVGAYVGAQTMVDTWATVGSCAQVGERVHISGGAGIGGVLEPIQANPVIIEDDAFIGARSEIAEGVIIGKGAVISMGVFIGASTKIVERDSGRIHRGVVPPYSVVVPGTLPNEENPQRPSLSCAVIIKQVDEKTRSKTSITALLRPS